MAGARSNRAPYRNRENAHSWRNAGETSQRTSSESGARRPIQPVGLTSSSRAGDMLSPAAHQTLVDESIGRWNMYASMNAQTPARKAAVASSNNTTATASTDARFQRSANTVAARARTEQSTAFLSASSFGQRRSVSTAQGQKRSTVDRALDPTVTVKPFRSQSAAPAEEQGSRCDRGNPRPPSRASVASDRSDRWQLNDRSAETEGSWAHGDPPRQPSSRNSRTNSARSSLTTHGSQDRRNRRTIPTQHRTPLSSAATNSNPSASDVVPSPNDDNDASQTAQLLERAIRKAVDAYVERHVERHVATVGTESLVDAAMRRLARTMRQEAARLERCLLVAHREQGQWQGQGQGRYGRTAVAEKVGKTTIEPDADACAGERGGSGSAGPEMMRGREGMRGGSCGCEVEEEKEEEEEEDDEEVFFTGRGSRGPIARSEAARAGLFRFELDD